MRVNDKRLVKVDVNEKKDAGRISLKKECTCLEKCVSEVIVRRES